MLPHINDKKDIDPKVLSYLDELKNTAYQGDIETSYASRLVMATDNSIYQKLPQAVLFPKSTSDIVEICRLANKPSFRHVRFSPRGGGTGTNGQSLTQYLVVDMSRHMQKILEINIKESWVKVQAGVVKDALNEVLKPLGFFFSPELSTSNRATIGGMINTDASGQGSLKYGKTSDHVLSVSAVFVDGSVLNTESLAVKKIEKLEQENFATAALKVSAKICKDQRTLIERVFPPLNRFLTGYDLKNAYQPEADCFDIARLLCGSEGTLAFISEAKINITKLPVARALVNIKYESFDAALRNAPMMVKANALSVETIDSTVLNLAKEDIVWHSVADLLTEVDGRELQAINIVEFADSSFKSLDKYLDALCIELDQSIENHQNGIVGYQICTDLESIDRIYKMRKKAVGLLGAMKGKAKPIAFAEDTCVPPEYLADFIIEYRDLLDEHNLDYGMFGHVDSGVIHVRPALDLCSIEQEVLIKTLSDKIVTLVAKYGGLMWGEHGKGYRSEYGPAFWGEALFLSLRKIKQAFDPFNQLNPGKICTPFDSQENLVQLNDKTRGYYDRQIPIQVRESFNQALDCNGNGLCFNYELSSPMCPSMKITLDRRHSPKGRAGIIREWLRLVEKEGVDIEKIEKKLMKKTPSILNRLRFLRQIFTDSTGDFSHQVMDVMNGCLSCKACASQCPVKVDVASFRARFIQLYHSRYPRPLKDYFVANIEKILPLMAKSPKVINGLMQLSLSKKLTRISLGLVDVPTLSLPNLEHRLKDFSYVHFEFAKMQALTDEEAKQYVFILQDPFTSYYEAELIIDFINLTEKLGKKPILLPFKANGKAQYVKGFLRNFMETAKETAGFLNKVSCLNIPIVGVDPALVLCYRDEYQEILSEQRGDFLVLTVQEWLSSFLTKPLQFSAQNNDIWYLLTHCTEKTKLPNTESDWADIFALLGIKVEKVALGCCGMAGTYGHEASNVELSKGIYSLSWQRALALLPKERCMSTGYSCRSQVKRMEQTQLLHPLQVLLRYLEGVS